MWQRRGPNIFRKEMIMSLGLIAAEDPVEALILGLGSFGAGLADRLTESKIVPGEGVGMKTLEDLVAILHRSGQGIPESGELAVLFPRPSPQVIRDVILRERRGITRLIQNVGALILIGDLAEPMGSHGLDAFSALTSAPAACPDSPRRPLRIAIITTLCKTGKTEKVLTTESIRARLSRTLDLVLPISIKALADRLGDRSTWAELESRLRQIACIAVGTIWKVHSGAFKVFPGIDPFRAEELRSSGEAVVWAGTGRSINESVEEALNVPYRNPIDMAKARGIVLLVGERDKSSPREIIRAIDVIKERTRSHMEVSVLPVPSSGERAQHAVALLAYGIPAPQTPPEQSHTSHPLVQPGSFLDLRRIPAYIRMGYTGPRPVKTDKS